MKTTLNHLQKKIVCAQSSAADGEPDDAIGFINQALALNPDLDTRKLLEKAGEEFSIGHPPTGETYLDLAFDAAATKPVEKTKNAALGKIKAYALSVDGPKCGTFAAAYGTEREMYLALFEQIGLNADETAKATEMLDTHDTELEDYLGEVTDGGLTTWATEECEIEVPIIGELLSALEKLLAAMDVKNIFFSNQQSADECTGAANAAISAIAKAKEVA